MVAGNDAFTEDELLKLVMAGIEKEKQFPETDFKTFGSVIINMLICFKKNLDQSTLGFAINSSYWRRYRVPSNRMRYTETEKDFWPFYKLMVHEQAVRILSGPGNYLGATRGFIGSQSPEDLEINLAIPNLRSRKTYFTSTNNFVVKPGFIESSFETLKKTNIKVVNIGMDEKKIADGIVLEKEVDENTGIYKYSSIGDIDYGLPDLNSYKDNILADLNHWSNKEINKETLENAKIFLESLETELAKSETKHENAVDELKKKGKTNTVTLPREYHRLTRVRCSRNEVKDLIESLCNLDSLTPQDPATGSARSSQDHVTGSVRSSLDPTTGSAWSSQDPATGSARSSLDPATGSVRSSLDPATGSARSSQDPATGSARSSHDPATGSSRTTDFDVEITLKFKSIIESATVCLLRPATHIFVIMANNAYGLKKGTHTSAIPLLYVRSGAGVKIKGEYLSLINQTITKLKELGITVICRSGDTAMHGILLKLRDGSPNNLIGLKNDIYSSWKKKSVKTLLAELRKRNQTNEGIPRPDHSKIKEIFFEELGDFRDNTIPEVIGVEILNEYDIKLKYSGTPEDERQAGSSSTRDSSSTQDSTAAQDGAGSSTTQDSTAAQDGAGSSSTQDSTAAQDEAGSSSTQDSTAGSSSTQDSTDGSSSTQDSSYTRDFTSAQDEVGSSSTQDSTAAQDLDVSSMSNQVAVRKSGRKRKLPLKLRNEPVELVEPIAKKAKKRTEPIPKKASDIFEKMSKQQLVELICELDGRSKIDHFFFKISI